MIFKKPKKKTIKKAYMVKQDTPPEKTVASLHPEFLKRFEAGEASFDIIAPQDMMEHTIEGGEAAVEQCEYYRSYKNSLE